MSKSNNIQPGHYRTYRESGKTIEVNGGPKPKYSNTGYYGDAKPNYFLVAIFTILMCALPLWFMYHVLLKTIFI